MKFQPVIKWSGSKRSQSEEIINRIPNKEYDTYYEPKDLYSSHEYLYSGNSSFSRTIGKSNSEYVEESLYIKLLKE